MRTRIASCLLVLATLTGCGYQLQGRVVQGGFGTISLVEPTDQRLQVQGVPGVRVQLVRDPNRMRREVIAEASTDADGVFTLETRSFGAGFLDERFEMVATRPGFGVAQSTMELPMDPSTRRVLVEIQRGGSGPNSSAAPGGNLYDEAAKYDPTIRSKGSGGN
jgi:hypothetical protein